MITNLVQVLKTIVGKDYQVKDIAKIAKVITGVDTLPSNLNNDNVNSVIDSIKESYPFTTTEQLKQIKETYEKDVICQK